VLANPVAEAEVGFDQGKSRHITHVVASYKDRTEALLAKLGETVSACPSFTVFDDGGSGSRVELSRLDLPNLGDRTVAVRARYPDTRSGVTDLVMIGVGHEVILLVAGGAPLPGDTLEVIARKAIAKLTAAQSTG
jgi:hypothetical protein